MIAATGRAIAAELLKILTTRMWWLLALILFGYVAFSAIAIAIAIRLTPEQAGFTVPEGALPPLVYSLATATGYVFPVIFGAMLVTGELRHRTLATAFLATPQRGIVLLAKGVAGLVVGLLYGVVGLLASAGTGAAALAATGADTGLDDPDIWAMFGRILLAMAIWGLVGVGVGVLIPSQVGSIVAILAFTQFVEPILRMAGSFVAWFGDIARFLPGALGDALVGSSIYSMFAAGTTDSLEWWQGGLLLAAYGIVFGAIGAFTTWRRDVT